jgi:hypothetical protein
MALQIALLIEFTMVVENDNHDKDGTRRIIFMVSDFFTSIKHITTTQSWNKKIVTF